MFFKRFLAVIALILVFSCVSCTSTGRESNNKQTETTTQNQSEKANAVSKIDIDRLGNSNANIANGGWIDEEDGWLYYGLRDGLYKCKEDGSQKEKLRDIEGGAFNINVVDEWVYYRCDGIYRIKTDGTGYEQIAAEDIRGGVHFIGNKIYNGSEYRMNFDGTEKERIYDKNVASGYTLNIVDGYIYFFDEEAYTQKEKIFRMKLDGSDLTAICDIRTECMVVDGDWIYFSNFDDKRHLYKMKTDGTEIQLLDDTGAGNIIVSDGWVYYGGINKIRIDGSDKQQICDESCDEIQLQGDWIYYSVDKKIYRVKTSGADRQLFATMGEVEVNNSTQSSNEINNSDDVRDVVLDHSFTTQFQERNKVTYPDFTISYPRNWMITSKSVNTSNETFVLENERGVEITYSHIGGVAEGQLGGGSGTMMSRVEVTKVADSSFIPGFVQATDHSDLGKFVVAKIKQTGLLYMKQDRDFRDVDGDVSFAVVPESRLGTDDSVNQAYSGYFAFWYTGYISLIASSPDGQFTEQETREVVAILNSFRNVK